MIYNFYHELTTFGLTFYFTIVTEVGKVKCSVHTYDLDKDKRPKAYAYEYEIMGIAYENGDNPLMQKGAKLLGDAFREVCDNNIWCAWSY